MVDHPGIGEHGIVGDLRSAALITTGGRVSWFCAGRFDSPSVFNSLLDEESGGRWDLRPVGEVAREQQFYFPDTNVLVTRFLTTDGIVEVQDFLVLRRAGDPEHRQRLVRRVVAVRGTVRMGTSVAPRPDYGREVPRVEAHDGAVRFTGADLVLGLRSTVALEAGAADATAEFTVTDGDTAAFVLEVDPADAPGDRGTEELDREVADLFGTTVGFWRSWLAGCTYRGRWREQVNRSALALKLLTHEPTGAVIAAPTMGLPEEIGGERNWDYRYVWIRDAAFTLYALLRLGFTAEADAFIDWLSRCIADSCAERDGEDGPLRVMYSIDGAAEVEESELDHLPGFRGSRPVLLGNGASAQLQLDIYGELIDSVYLYDKHSAGISHETWTNLCTLLDWLLDNWDRPDAGIWETRGKPSDHTFSRVMCWVAVERMIRMARRRGLPGDLAHWSRVRDEIYRQVFDQGWDAERGAFVQSYDDPAPDASLLLMPLVKFCSPTEPRFLRTLERIEESLVVDSLVFRYAPDGGDGLDGHEATFTLCSFWYIEALTRAGRTDRARVLLDKTFTYGNHVGLYAEQIALTGEQLGNFPQAFTHLALISATLNLDRALG